MKQPLVCLVLLAATLGFAQAGPAKSSNPFEGLHFLLGDWVGTGTGEPGEGSGGFSLKPELNGQILVRRNFAEYPATKDGPAFRHEDVMNIFMEDGKLRAIYFDSEGHVIHYLITTEKDSAIFLSEGDGPRYRLTYQALDPTLISIKFEMAPPGGGEFKTYIQATAKRK